MAEDTLVRPARASDVDALARLWLRFMREEEDAVPDADAEGALAGWQERLRTQIAGGLVLVAEAAGEVVGFLAGIDSGRRAWGPAGVLYVVDLYVLPEARHTPAAGRLMRALAATAVSQGYAALWTNTHARNRRMQVLLRRAGFEALEGFEIPGLEEQGYYRKRLH